MMIFYPVKALVKTVRGKRLVLYEAFVAGGCRYHWERDIGDIDFRFVGETRWVQCRGYMDNHLLNRELAANTR